MHFFREHFLRSRAAYFYLNKKSLSHLSGKLIKKKQCIFKSYKVCLGVKSTFTLFHCAYCVFLSLVTSRNVILWRSLLVKWTRYVYILVQLSEISQVRRFFFFRFKSLAGLNWISTVILTGSWWIRKLNYNQT